MGAIIGILVAVGGTVAVFYVGGAIIAGTVETLKNLYKASAPVKVATATVASALGLGVYLGLEVKSDKDQKAYKYAYTEFEKIEEKFEQKPLSAPISACFKDAAAKKYVHATSFYFNQSTASDTTEVNKDYRGKRRFWHDYGQDYNPCEEMITSNSSKIEIENARKFGDILKSARLTPVLKDPSKKSITGDDPVFFKIEASLK